MIKKYFALTIVAASVAVAGCSSDDDTPTTPVEPVVPVSPDATPGEGTSAYDSVFNSAEHSTLLAVIDSIPGLANDLDNPASQFTIFAPSNAAFDAAAAAVEDDEFATAADYSDAANQAKVARILNHHVVTGSESSQAIIDGVGGATEEAPYTLATLLTDGNDDAGAAVYQMLTFGAATDGSGSYTITDGAGNVVPLALVAPEAGAVESTTGEVHSLDNLLNPADAPVAITPDPDPDPTGPSEGTFQAALTAQTGYDVALAVLESDSFKLNTNDGTDADPWAVFVPSDALLAGAAYVRNDHLLTGAPLKTPEELIATPPASSFGGVPLTIGGTDAASLTINGFVATEVFRGDSIVYTIDGVLAQ